MTTIFDRAGFLHRTAGDAKLVSDLASTFLDSIHSEWDSLINYINKNDLQKIEMQAHSLKNSCQVFFKGDLITHLQHVEVSARDGKLDSLDLASNQLKSDWAVLQKLFPLLEELVA